MNTLYENMLRFGTKNLNEQQNKLLFHKLPEAELYQKLANREGMQGKITAKEIADVLDYAEGTFNDYEAYIQSALAAIENTAQAEKVFRILGRSPVEYVADVFGTRIPFTDIFVADRTGDLSIEQGFQDYHGNGKVPTIADSAKRLKLRNISMKMTPKYYTDKGEYKNTNPLTRMI